MLLLCTGEVPDRLEDPRTRAGDLFDVVLMDQVFGSLPVFWLTSGLIKAMDGRGRRDALVRLNRKMVAALTGGTAWSEDLFTISAFRLAWLFGRLSDPKNAQRAEQFTDQAWSIVEYLSGEPATEARRAAFFAFLRDKRTRSHQAESFFQHFGFGFGSMLDEWRQWVLDQGIGVHEPPPPHIREALYERVLPVIRDRRAPRADRIQAIRDWRKAAYAMGADVLIDLLRDPGDIPREEIIGSLRVVSGLSWGDEPERWQAWWNDLPASREEPSERADRKSDELEVAT